MKTNCLPEQLGAKEPVEAMGNLIDDLVLEAAQAGIPNLAMSVALQQAAVQIAKLEGISDEAIEEGLRFALVQAENLVARVKQAHVH